MGTDGEVTARQQKKKKRQREPPPAAVAGDDGDDDEWDPGAAPPPRERREKRKEAHDALEDDEVSDHIPCNKYGLSANLMALIALLHGLWPQWDPSGRSKKESHGGRPAKKKVRTARAPREEENVFAAARSQAAARRPDGGGATGAAAGGASAGGSGMGGTGGGAGRMGAAAGQRAESSLVREVVPRLLAAVSQIKVDRVNSEAWMQLMTATPGPAAEAAAAAAAAAAGGGERSSHYTRELWADYSRRRGELQKLGRVLAAAQRADAAAQEEEEETAKREKEQRLQERMAMLRGTITGDDDDE